MAECREGNYLLLEDISEPLSQAILKACSSSLIILVRATASVCLCTQQAREAPGAALNQ